MLKLKWYEITPFHPKSQKIQEGTIYEFRAVINHLNTKRAYLIHHFVILLKDQ
jgi:hypothetical protein